MCIRYDVETGDALLWSRNIGAMIPEIDWRQGKDTYPGYATPTDILMRRQPQRNKLSMP